MTIWRLRADHIIDWQEITDSEYFDEVHAGWREHLGSELGSNLARYSTSGPPWYPDPAGNEWPIETCVTDGRDSIPAHMTDNVEATIKWWSAPREQGDGLFADDVHIFFQGRSWPLGGHHHGREGLARVMEGFNRIWPTPSTIVKTNFWANDDRVLIQWFTRNTTWKGQPCRNSGWTVWKFQDRKVVDWRTYTDTIFYAELHAGWREAFGEEFGSQFPNWPEPKASRYPRPEEHE